MEHITYHKINNLRPRSKETNEVLFDQFSEPEFEAFYNSNYPFVCSYKNDGTNMSYYWDGKTLEIHGKTVNANIPKHLLVKMKALITEEQLSVLFPYDEEKPFTVILYGEGYGSKIQAAGNKYFKDNVNFALFDININGVWMAREFCEEIAQKLGITIVPVIGVMTLMEAENMVIAGFKSPMTTNGDLEAEGLICKPLYDLKTRSGKRIVVKIKTKNYSK
jgi:hypothetical protein